MDPNANLAESLRLATRISALPALAISSDDAQRLAELVLALDEWLAHEGFLPQRWAPRR